MKYVIGLCLLLLLNCLNTTISSGQSAILDVESIDKGVLLPRMTMAQRDAIILPAHALIIYQLDQQPGFYYNSGTAAAPVWMPMSGNDPLPCESRIAIDSLPFSIDSSGSYYVTSHLIGVTDLDGISVNVSNVSIDLNGFTLLAGGGTIGSGILVTAAIKNLYVHNGNIQGWGDEGVSAFMAENSRFENLRLLSNQHDGLMVGNNNSISNCQSASNGLDGIDTGRNCTIKHCVTNLNGDDGIESDRGCIISSSASYQNIDDGFNSGFANTVIDNVSTENGDRGFFINSGSTVGRNSSSYNIDEGFLIGSACIVQHNTARANSGHGFETLQESFFTDNISDSNAFAGFSTSSNRVRFDNNQSTTNGTYGYEVAGSSDCIITRNTAIGNTLTNYFISGGNSLGLIVGPALSSVTNPFANISL